MPKHTTAGNDSVQHQQPLPIRVVIVTLDSHLASTVERAQRRLAHDLPGLTIALHAASEWGDNPAALAACNADIARGDIIIATMLFMEDHIQAVRPALIARRDQCDALVCAMSAADVARLTRMGRFVMDNADSGPLAFLKKLRPKSDKSSTAGARQMTMLRRLPKILRFIPGTAQDVRAYFLTLQYWLAGSEENIISMVRMLVDRYADGARRTLRGTVKAAPPVDYPDVGLYHPRATSRITDRLADLPGFARGESNKSKGESNKPTVGLLLMRSYLLAGNADHYDGVIDALEARGLRVIPAFATGLDSRPAIEKFFIDAGQPTVDAVVSLTGFSLVGGPAYNDAKAAEAILAQLDVPYVAAHPVEFQTLQDWESSERGLLPVESTIMVAIPELDGATGPMVFGGRDSGTGSKSRDMHSHNERANTLAARVAKLVALRRSERAQRKIAIVLFNFPPNSGSTGTAAHLAVFESLHHTLRAMKAHGYSVELPTDVTALREAILHGNAERFGADANVHTRIRADDHVKREPYLREIERQWGPAPGRQQSDGGSIFVLGCEFGNVLVGIQPAFGYEGDPMRLLFEHGFAPTHAFSAFYRYLREDFGAHAVLHFGTHGALEFMPGKQSGMSAACWPDRLIGDLPNIYLYAANNPSEGTIAKRRASATLVSYLTPPVCNAGLYRGLVDLKGALDRWRSLAPDAADDRVGLADLIQSQAAVLDLATAQPLWTRSGVDSAGRSIASLNDAVLQLEYALIPQGLHVVGEAMSAADRVDMLSAMAEAGHGVRPDRRAIEALVAGSTPRAALALIGIDASRLETPDAANASTTTLELLEALEEPARQLAEEHELPALMRALDGRYMRPAPGGDLLRAPNVLPTGRNLHGFDPFRIPSAFAVKDGATQAARVLARHLADGHPQPESIAIVLWGTDNLKNEGAPIAQALALMGAAPRFDSYGRLAGAQLLPLATLGRPRIDVMITLSGIFRDLLPLQTKLLAEAAFLAASADEPIESNFIRKHALAYQAAHNCDLETAALRVFSNAEGAYGSNVNMMIENSRWNDEDELAETYSRRKGFAYGRSGRPVQQPELLASVLAGVDLAYQNLDSVEVGVTTVDHYFDTLGGISRAVRRARGAPVAVYIGDQTNGEGAVRTLSEQVAIEARTRILNPKWYEGMLKHGYEGVRQIEAHVTNTLGWSATTGEVEPWVYRQITETFMLDPAMRERLAALNPTASAKFANRLIEAHERNYWTPEPAVLEALRRAGEELEDRLEGIPQRIAA